MFEYVVGPRTCEGVTRSLDAVVFDRSGGLHPISMLKALQQGSPLTRKDRCDVERRHANDAPRMYLAFGVVQFVLYSDYWIAYMLAGA